MREAGAERRDTCLLRWICPRKYWCYIHYVGGCSPCAGRKPLRLRPAQAGFTLVELLVVIAIIGILIALLLPAVQAAREAARRMQCTNNLKQIMLGMHNYHAAHQYFPPGSLAYDPNNRASWGRAAVHHWTMFLWPYVELNNLAQAYNWNVGFRGPDCDNVNGKIFRTVIPLYQCPSDNPGVYGNESPLPTDGYTRSNYVACHSPDGFIMEKGITNFDKSCNEANNPARKRALFNWNVFRGIRDVRDGTSNTVAVSELIAGRSGSADLRGLWVSDLGIGYSHLRTPNSPVPDQLLGGRYCDCSKRKAPCVGNSPCWSGVIYAARSYHAGGVNAALADGSVRFFSDSIDGALWIGLASIDDGEVVRVE
jgi:prepilin-type N-terminal cleavage/methylation domain-containing protein/prepilin-type processing-associated H-X9-DG protein